MRGLGHHVHRDMVYKWPTKKVFQIFIAEPSGYNFYFREEDDMESYRQYIINNSITLYVHSRYLDIPWKGGSYAYLQKEMDRCVKIGAYGFVLHLHKATKENIYESLMRLSPPPQLKIFLENSAMRNNPYTKPRDFINLYNYLYRDFNIGICIDTAHLWVSGVEPTKAFFKSISSKIPSPDILIHLNDSTSKKGSGIDVHETIGKGLIWGKGNLRRDVLVYIVNMGVNIILERDIQKVSQDYEYLGTL